MTRLEIEELKRLSVPVEVAWLEALDARGPVLGLRCSDPLVDAEVHHGHCCQSELNIFKETQVLCKNLQILKNYQD